MRRSSYLTKSVNLTHCLETQLPFLQQVLGDFTLAPIICGHADAEQVANLLDRLWGGPETLIVVSSDLSHYLDYRACRALDEATRAAIERLDPLALTSERACGAVPMKGLLAAAGRRGMQVKTLDLCNSGDTAGRGIALSAMALGPSGNSKRRWSSATTWSGVMAL